MNDYEFDKEVYRRQSAEQEFWRKHKLKCEEANAAGYDQLWMYEEDQKKPKPKWRNIL